MNFKMLIKFYKTILLSLSLFIITPSIYSAEFPQFTEEWYMTCSDEEFVQATNKLDSRSKKNQIDRRIRWRGYAVKTRMDLDLKKSHIKHLDKEVKDIAKKKDLLKLELKMKEKYLKKDFTKGMARKKELLHQKKPLKQVYAAKKIELKQVFNEEITEIDKSTKRHNEYKEAQKKKIGKKPVAKKIFLRSGKYLPLAIGLGILMKTEAGERISQIYESFDANALKLRLNHGYTSGFAEDRPSVVPLADFVRSNLADRISQAVDKSVDDMKELVSTSSENLSNLKQKVYNLVLNKMQEFKSALGSLEDKKIDKNAVIDESIEETVKCLIEYEEAAAEKKEAKRITGEVDKIIAKWKQEDTLFSEYMKESKSELDAIITDILVEEENRINKFIAAEQVKSIESEIKSNLKFEQFQHNFMNSMVIASSISALMGNPVAARKITSFGTGALNIASGIKAYNSGVGIVGNLEPIALITSGIAMLASMFNDAEDNSTEEIIKAINHAMIQLSKQMYEFYTHTMARFDNIEQQLKDNQKALLQAFFKLHMQQNNIESAIKDFHETFVRYSEAQQSGLEQVNDRINHTHNSLTNNLNAIRIEDINELIERAVTDVKRENLSLEKFSGYITDLYTKAFVRAKESHLTGANIDLDNYTSISQALSTHGPHLFNHAAFHNVNLLNQIICKRLNISYKPLANPLAWISCVETLIKILHEKFALDAHYPPNENTKSIDLEKLNVLYQEGLRLQRFIKILHEQSCIDFLYKDYDASLAELSFEIDDMIKDFEKRQTERAKNIHFQQHQENLLKVNDRDPKLVTSVSMVKRLSEQIAYNWNIRESSDSFVKKGWSCIEDWSKNGVSNPKSLKIYRSEISDCELIAQKLNDEVNTHNNQLLSDLNNRYSTTINSLSSQLFIDIDSEQSISINGLIFPADTKQYSLVLNACNFNLDIPQEYIWAEQIGLGRIKYFYEVIENFFYIKAYFSTQEFGNQLMFICKYPYAKLDAYTNDENIWHYWHGGYYAKPNDNYRKVITYGKAYGTEVLGTGQLPSLEPYPSQFLASSNNSKPEVIDTTDLDGNINILRAKQRIAFNDEVIAASKPSTTSKVFNLIEKIDAQFKLLDALLALMHGDQYLTDPNFVNLRQKDLLFLKDKEAILNFIQQYKDINNGLSLSQNYLSHYLKLTSQKVQAIIGAIKSIHLPAQFNALTTSCNRLNSLIDFYNQRTVVPRLSIQSSDLKEEKVEAEKDKAINTLVAQNQVLTGTVQAMQSELSEIKEQMRLMLALLTKQQK